MQVSYCTLSWRLNAAAAGSYKKRTLTAEMGITRSCRCLFALWRTRDLYAYLTQNGKQTALKKPSVDAFAVENHDLDIKVTVENTEACPQYAG